MADPDPGQGATESSDSGGSGNVFTRKMGPLPLWGWMGIGLAVALGFYYFKQNKANSSQNANTGTLPTTQTASGTTPASLIPQFVNQVYTQDQPPATQPVNVTVNSPPPGPIQVSQASNPPNTQTVTANEGASHAGFFQWENIQGQNYGIWNSTGQYSLNTIAKSHNVTAQQIVAATVLAGGNVSAFSSYVNKGNFNATLPKGVVIAFPSPTGNQVSV